MADLKKDSMKKKYTIFLLLFFVSYQDAAYKDSLEKIARELIEVLNALNENFILQESKMTKADRLDKYQTLFKANEKALNAKDDQIVDLRRKFEENLEKERQNQAEEFSKDFFTAEPKQTVQDFAALLSAVSVEFTRANDKNKEIFINKSFKELLDSFPFKGRISRRSGSVPKKVIEQFVKDKPDIAQYNPAILYTIYTEKKYQPYVSQVAIFRSQPQEVAAFLEQMTKYLNQEIDTKFLAQEDIKKLITEQEQLNDRKILLTEKLKEFESGEDLGPVPGDSPSGISHIETIEATLKRVEEEEAARKAHEGPQEPVEGSGRAEEELRDPKEWEEENRMGCLLSRISFLLFCFFIPIKAGLNNNGIKTSLDQLIDSLQVLEKELSPAYLSMKELQARIETLKNPNNYQEYDQLVNLMLDYLRRTVLEKQGVYDEQFLKATLSQAARDILDQYNNYQLSTKLMLGTSKTPNALSIYIKTVSTTQPNQKLIKSVIKQYIEGVTKPLSSFFNISLSETDQTLNEIIKRYVEVLRNAYLNDQIKEFDIMQLTNLLKIVINYAYATENLSALSLAEEPFKSALKWSLEDEVEALYKLRSTGASVSEEPEQSQEAKEFKEEQERIQKIQEEHDVAYKDLMEQWKEKLQEVGIEPGETSSEEEEDEPGKWDEE